MRSLLACLAAALLALACAASGLAREPGWGHVYTVSGKVSVRENPAADALQVRVLKSGQKVRVDFEDAGWAAAFDPAETVRAETRAQGYVRLAELRAEARPEASFPSSEKAAAPEKAGKAQKPAKPEKSEKSGKAAPVDPARKNGAPKQAKPQAFGEIRVADRNMAVRAGRDKGTEFLRLLQAGQRVRVDSLEDGWYVVFAPDETVRDLSRAWGYGRDRYLVPEKDYAGQPLPAPAEPAAQGAPAKPPAAAKEPEARSVAKQKDGAAVAYSVLGRQADHLRPLSPVVLRVRLDVPAPPAPEALRRIVREIWKAERRKSEDLQVDVLLPGMDQGGLAYCVARFHDDGRLREFWWREVVLRPKR
jgi:hypothetical protein